MSVDSVGVESEVTYLLTHLEDRTDKQPEVRDVWNLRYGKLSKTVRERFDSFIKNNTITKTYNGGKDRPDKKGKVFDDEVIMDPRFGSWVKFIVMADESEVLGVGDIEAIFESEYIRPSDGARLKILSEKIETNAAPHCISENYVMEGVMLPTLEEKDLAIKTGGVAGLTRKLGNCPYVVIAEMGGGVKTWIDVEPKIIPADFLAPFQLDGHKVWLTKFGELTQGMDRPTIASILSKAHINTFDAQGLFTMIRGELRRVVEMSPEASTAISLWLIGTYVHDAFEAFPYIWLNGVKGSGKTRVLEFVNETAYHAEMNMRMSDSALFRKVDQHHCTLCYDEAENLLVHGNDKSESQDRVSLINGGYRKSGSVELTEKDKDGNFKPVRFRSYSPKALASIQPIDEALQSRCLLINMLVARDTGKSKENFNIEMNAEIRKRLYQFRFAEGIGFYSRARDPVENKEMSEKYGLMNRDWELFKPLLFLASSLCPEWLPELTAFIEHQKIVRRVDNAFNPDACVMDVLLSFADGSIDAGSPDARTRISYKELMGKLKEDYPELKWMTGRSLGNTFRRLGLDFLVDRANKGMFIKLSQKHFQDVCQRNNFLLVEKGVGVDSGHIEDFSEAPDVAREVGAK